MVYFISDLHLEFYNLKFLCEHYNTSINDIVIVLGDAQLNYFLNNKDKNNKKYVNSLPATFLFVYGNHESRPENIKTYKSKYWHNGIVYYEDAFPKLLFAKDGEIFNIYNKNFLVCGGAYSIDKYIRQKNNIPYWEDEQPSNITKYYIEKKLEKYNWTIDYVLSHTCPLKFEPTETFKNKHQQYDIDKNTEIWFDKIEEKLNYKHWYCGHYHIDLTIDDKISFVYNIPKSLLLK